MFFTNENEEDAESERPFDEPENVSGNGPRSRGSKRLASHRRSKETALLRAPKHSGSKARTEQNAVLPAFSDRYGAPRVSGV